MAKSTKKQKIEEVLNEPPVTPKSEEIATPEVIETIEETKEVNEEVLEMQKKEEPTPELTPAPPVVATYNKATDPNLSMQDRISAFLDGKSGFVRMNDFLKSLFPITRGNEPPVWTRPSEMKKLQAVLERMQQAGEFSITGNNHRLLGKFYYAGTDQKQQHHNLATVNIECRV